MRSLHTCSRMTTSDNNLLPLAADLLVPARSRPQPSGLFSSFWMAGYESACHINRRGERLDMIAATQHDRLLDDDYARLRSVGIGAARDTVRWHLVETAGAALSISRPCARCSRRRSGSRCRSSGTSATTAGRTASISSRPRSSSASHASAAGSPASSAITMTGRRSTRRSTRSRSFPGRPARSGGSSRMPATAAAN